MLDGLLDDVVAGGVADDGHDLEDRHAGADELRKSASEAGQADFMDELAEDGELEFVAVPNLPSALGLEEGFDAEDGAADDRDDEVPVAADEVAEVEEELCGRGELRAEVGEDFAEDGDDADDEEGGDRECDEEHDDRVGHGGLDLLFQPRGGFEEASETVENFGEQTAGFARFHHAGVKAVEDPGVFRDGLVKRIALLHERADFADDAAQAGLFFRVGLLVERGQAGDEREAGIDHGRELAGEKHEVGFVDLALGREGLRGGALLDGEDHQAAGHQRVDGVVFVERLLDAGDGFSSGVAGGVGESEHAVRRKHARCQLGARTIISAIAAHRAAGQKVGIATCQMRFPSHTSRLTKTRRI